MNWWAIRFGRVALWTLTLPIIGYAIFTLLTIWPVFGLLLGPNLAKFVYGLGAVPCFVAACLFEFQLRKMPFAKSILWTGTGGLVASWGWILFIDGSAARLSSGSLYALLALGFTGVATAVLMPVIDREMAERKLRREWLAAQGFEMHELRG